MKAKSQHSAKAGWQKPKLRRKRCNQSWRKALAKKNEGGMKYRKLAAAGGGWHQLAGGGVKAAAAAMA
jgi:hypothetical protein